MALAIGKLIDDYTLMVNYQNAIIYTSIQPQ